MKVIYDKRPVISGILMGQGLLYYLSYLNTSLSQQEYRNADYSDSQINLGFLHSLLFVLGSGFFVSADILPFDNRLSFLFPVGVC